MLARHGKHHDAKKFITETFLRFSKSSLEKPGVLRPGNGERSNFGIERLMSAEGISEGLRSFNRPQTEKVPIIKLRARGTKKTKRRIKNYPIQPLY